MTTVTTVVLTVIALLVNVVQAYFWTYNRVTGVCELRPQAMHLLLHNNNSSKDNNL